MRHYPYYIDGEIERGRGKTFRDNYFYELFKQLKLLFVIYSFTKIIVIILRSRSSTNVGLSCYIYYML